MNETSMMKLRMVGGIAAAAAVLFSLAGCSTGTAVKATPVAAPSASHSAAPVAPPKPVAQPVAVQPSACVATPAGVKQIYVSIGSQHLWACTGGVLFAESAVTTGASALTNVHDATPTGQFRITGRVRNTVLAGHDVNGSWHDPVTYWMPFDGGDGFHDAPWQTFPLGSPLYTTQGSHGCIHVDPATLASIFDWAPVGTLVTIRA